MQLTTWRDINKEFKSNARFSKKQWCELIHSRAVPGMIIDGEPFIDEARFFSSTVHNRPSANNDLPEIDLLS